MIKPLKWILCLLATFAAFANTTAFGQDAEMTAKGAATIGNNAWMLTSTALVLFMTIPGLALFYGGLVSRKNVLSVLMHCFALACVLSIVWLVCGYSFTLGEKGGWFGGFGHLMHHGVAADGILSSVFQMTFFIITPALIVGTFVERIKFSAMLLFSVLWVLLVYTPVCHITWFGGTGENVSLFTKWGVIDLAGGIVVHITAGVAALIACIMVGKRKHPTPPHNLPMTVTGTAMLWVGWFGFNAGSQGGASDAAAMTLFVTHISAAAAACIWMLIDWTVEKKPTVLGIATGAIAGLAAITPAAGVATPIGALLIGTCSGACCWWASVKLKNAIGYDDSLDVVGVHGVGGLIGTLLAAVVGSTLFGGEFSLGKQLGIQALASVITILYTAVVTIVILLFVKAVCRGLRVSEEHERIGLDQATHGESAYND
ncbi:MAG: ammonium transporter [Verrucomicrobiales bacterium]|nr:ammonium transporter [Verrucomicrobiales bacterium]HQZ28483.1 ammonium transporter [Verrucomicrobiales bacterium]